MGQILNNVQIAEQKLASLVGNEFGDYSFVWKITPNLDYNDYNGEDDKLICLELEYRLKLNKYLNNLTFFYDIKNDQLIVDMTEGEGYTEKIKEYDYSIKYFWIKIKWDD